LLEERLGLLPELPIMALFDFEKFEGDLGWMDYEWMKSADNFIF
jgi:hypothetical protein